MFSVHAKRHLARVFKPLRFEGSFRKSSVFVTDWCEQSITWRILLRNDRKSRHRRIKKQRRYERLAAASQLSTVERKLSFQIPLAWREQSRR